MAVMSTGAYAPNRVKKRRNQPPREGAARGPEAEPQHAEGLAAELPALEALLVPLPPLHAPGGLRDPR